MAENVSYLVYSRTWSCWKLCRAPQRSLPRSKPTPRPRYQASLSGNRCCLRQTLSRPCHKLRRGQPVQRSIQLRFLGKNIQILSIELLYRLLPRLQLELRHPNQQWLPRLQQLLLQPELPRLLAWLRQKLPSWLQTGSSSPSTWSQQSHSAHLRSHRRRHRSKPHCSWNQCNQCSDWWQMSSPSCSNSHRWRSCQLGTQLAPRFWQSLAEFPHQSWRYWLGLLL